MEKTRGWGFGRTALLVVFLPQAVLAWLTSLPVQLGQVAVEPAVGWIGWVGAVLAVVGIGFESIGDAQLAAFKKDPANKGQVMDKGLWRYPAPELFRRRLRLVGSVSDRGRDRAGAVGHRGPAVPDLYPDEMVGDRHHRKGHPRHAARLCRLCAPDQRLHSLAAEEALGSGPGSGRFGEGHPGGTQQN
jgi:hypothetical protein